MKYFGDTMIQVIFPVLFIATIWWGFCIDAANDAWDRILEDDNERLGGG